MQADEMYSSPLSSASPTNGRGLYETRQHFPGFPEEHSSFTTGQRVSVDGRPGVIAGDQPDTDGNYLVTFDAGSLKEDEIHPAVAIQLLASRPDETTGFNGISDDPVSLDDGLDGAPFRKQPGLGWSWLLRYASPGAGGLPPPPVTHRSPPL